MGTFYEYNPDRDHGGKEALTSIETLATELARSQMETSDYEYNKEVLTKALHGFKDELLRAIAPAAREETYRVLRQEGFGPGKASAEPPDSKPVPEKPLHVQV